MTHFSSWIVEMGWIIITAIGTLSDPYSCCRFSTICTKEAAINMDQTN